MDLVCSPGNGTQDGFAALLRHREVSLHRIIPNHVGIWLARFTALLGREFRKRAIEGGVIRDDDVGS